MKVVIGRIVRFVDHEGQIWPAIVVVVHSEALVDLQVFRQADIHPASSVTYNQDKASLTPHTWHWPDRG